MTQYRRLPYKVVVRDYTNIVTGQKEGSMSELETLREALKQKQNVIEYLEDQNKYAKTLALNASMYIRKFADGGETGVFQDVLCEELEGWAEA